MSPDIQHSKLIKQLNHQDLTLQKCEFIGSKLGLDLLENDTYQTTLLEASRTFLQLQVASWTNSVNMISLASQLAREF